MWFFATSTFIGLIQITKPWGLEAPKTPILKVPGSDNAQYEFKACLVATVQSVRGRDTNYIATKVKCARIALRSAQNYGDPVPGRPDSQVHSEF